MSPQYDYYCPQCHKRFGMNKSVEKRHEARCPKCKTKGKLMPSAFSFSFRGV